MRRQIDAMHQKGLGLSPVAYAIKLAVMHDLLPHPMRALDPFGMCGLRKTVDYLSLCDSIDFFEINEVFATEAQRRLPIGTVHCKDSIWAINNRNLPRRDYSFVLLDNPAGVFGDYCEHFDLFPALYESLADDAVLLMNVQLDEWVNPSELEHRSRRRAFYCGSLESANSAIDFYKSLANSAGFATTFSEVVPHPGNMFFLLQRLRRSTY